MKYYLRSVMRNLTYQQALSAMEKGCFVSREEWDGLHFIHDNIYTILLKTGEILENPNEVYSTDKNDWCIVIPNEEAKRIIEQNFKLRDY